MEEAAVDRPPPVGFEPELITVLTSPSTASESSPKRLIESKNDDIKLKAEPSSRSSTPVVSMMDDGPSLDPMPPVPTSASG